MAKQTTKQTVQPLLIALYLGLIALLCVIIYAISVKTNFEVECDFQEWKELPEGAEIDFGSRKLLMYPDGAKCRMTFEAPLYMAMVAAIQ